MQTALIGVSVYANEVFAAGRVCVGEVVRPCKKIFVYKKIERLTVFVRHYFGKRAARAMDANSYAMLTDGVHQVSFDRVVEVMKRTGHDLPSLYKETGEGGLAEDYQKMWDTLHKNR